MKAKAYLLCLDRYHQGDPLFLKELAQHFARAEPGQVPALILHGSGEKLERTLEAEGLFPERQEGVVQTETPQQAALAERAAREANQELVALFTDEMVTAVGLQGSDRGLLRRTEDGDVTAGALGWVEDLVKMRVVPVISALAEGSAGQHPEGSEATRRQEGSTLRDGSTLGVEVAPAHAAVTLASVLESFDVTICFLAKGALPGEEVAASALDEDMHAEPEVVCQAARAHDSVWLTNLRTLFAESGPQGTRVHGE